MAKGPYSPGNTTVSEVNGGNPRFNDTGGHTGSDVLTQVLHDEDRRLMLAIEEVSVPLPVHEEGRLFDLSVGVVDKSGSLARVASQKCIHQITQAPHRFYEGQISLGDIIKNVRSLARLAIAENERVYGISECKKSCILATLGKCPLAMLDLEISESAFAELVGIQLKSKKPPKKEPSGVSTFKFFSSRSFSIRPPGLPLSTEEQLQEVSAEDHICKWWSKYRPKPKQRHVGDSTKFPEQSVLDL